MVSIVIPVYNVDKYLEGCLNSIVSQTYINWECILIDDGCTDGSGTICDKYAYSDCRFSVYHIKNQGVGNARNMGIDLAKGEWITFIDSDDIVTTDYIESLVLSSECNNSDLTITRFDRESDGKIKNYTYYTGLFKRSELGSVFLRQPYQFFYSSCYKLYKKNILDKYNIRFKTDISLGEDEIFSATYLSFVNSVCFINGGVYKYQIHSDSLIQRKKSFKDYANIHLYLHTIFINYIIGKFSPEMELFFGKELIKTLESTLLFLNSLNDTQQKINYIKQLDLKFYKKYKKCISWKEWIIKQTLIYHFPRLYLFFFKKSFKR